MVIPSALRKRLGFHAGQDLLLQVNGQGLQIMTLEQAMNAFQDEVIRLAGPNGSLADELIQDRRAEARKDQGD